MAEFSPARIKGFFKKQYNATNHESRSDMGSYMHPHRLPRKGRDAGTCLKFYCKRGAAKFRIILLTGGVRKGISAAPSEIFSGGK